MNALEAAQYFASWLRKEYGADPSVWDAEKVKAQGWGPNDVATADAAVCLEGGPELAEMQVWERGWFEKGMQPVEGVFVEPWSEWLMYFYNDKKERNADG